MTRRPIRPRVPATIVDPRRATPLRVILYLRLSDARNENGSFTDREVKLRERAAALGWTVVRVVIENDEMPGGSRSASAFKRRKITLPDGRTELRVYRPGFRSILDDLAHGRADALLAEDLDRAMRDPRDLEDLIDVVEQRRCSADSLSGSLRFTDGGTDSEITMARLMVTIANKSSRDTARRVSAGRERKARTGEFGGGRRRFGFRADGVTIDPDEAAEIRQWADQVRGNVALRSIARDLRERDVPTVTNTRWTATTVREILLRPRNAGILIYRGAEVGTAPWEPIVPRDEWERVVDILTDPERRIGPGPAPKWLGSGLYRCGAQVERDGGAVECGGPLYVIQSSHRTDTPAYRCVAKGPGHVLRNVARVDGYVIGEIVALLSDPEAAERLAAPTGDDVDINALRGNVALWRQRKVDLAAAFAEGEISRPQLVAGTKRLDAKLADAEALLASRSSRSPSLELLDAADAAEAWQALPLGTKRAVVAELATVTILPAGRGGRFHGPSQVRMDWAAR